MANNQYENFPEVAPHHHGLHPIEAQQPNQAWAHKEPYTPTPVPEESKSGRRLWGLKPWVFWTLIAVISIVVIGASVGGAVAGTKSNKSDESISRPTSASPSPPTSTPTPLPAPNPNRITTDCPTSNASTFAPQEPRNGNPGLQNFLKYCNSSTDGENLISAMVIDFNSCIALCSNWNSWQPDGKKCASATFLVDGRVPANCWAKTGKMVSSVPGSEGAALLL